MSLPLRRGVSQGCERGLWEDLQTQKTHSGGAGFLVSCGGRGQLEAQILETFSCELRCARVASSHPRDAFSESRMTGSVQFIKPRSHGGRTAGHTYRSRVRRNRREERPSEVTMTRDALGSYWPVSKEYLSPFE